MTFEQLLYLQKVYEHHSIALASEALHITRQALSASLKKLEQELDVPLFIRTVKGIDLTPKGHEVLLFAENILEQQKAFLQRFYDSHTPSTLTGRILCVCQYLPRMIIFPDLIAYFIKHYPHIQINNFPVIERQALLSQVAAGMQDIGFIYQIDHPSLNLYPIAEDLQFYPITEIRPYIWCSITSPIAYRQKLNLAEIIHYPILRDQHTGNFLEETIFKLFSKPPVGATLPINRDPGELEAFLENSQVLLWDMGIGNRSVYQHLTVDPHLRCIPVQLPSEITITIGYVLQKHAAENPVLPILLSYLENLSIS